MVQKDKKAKKLQLIDISKHIDKESADVPFYSKTIVLGTIFITIAIIVAITIAILIKFFV